MRKLTIMISIMTLSTALASCYESNSEELAPAPVATPPTPAAGIIVNGSTYYQNSCGICHKAGQDDPTSAFGASDLAQRHDLITTNMSNFDTTSSFNLMGAFVSVPEQRVADLKAYLASVP